ncbi:hypothetical protein KSP40_PGU019437 [Platanthera guangdongensis]|uniref:Uncharacterized protein n=1 Tax=Platanthera guangdongensis TaxID=2320717 RepID=A0ABR2MRV1_9ASPA
MDSVVEMMQIVAAEAKKSAAELVKALPNGRVKEAAVKLERIAALVDKNAAFADSFIDKQTEVNILLSIVDSMSPVINPVRKKRKSKARGRQEDYLMDNVKLKCRKQIDDAVIELDEKLHPGIPDPREVKTKAVTEASLIIPKVKIGDMAAAIAAARGSTLDPKAKAG